MQSFRLAPVAVLLVQFLAVAPPVHAQLVLGFSGGVSAGGRSWLDGGRYQPGFAAKVFIGSQPSRRLATRVEVSISQFTLRQEGCRLSPDLCALSAPSGGAPVGIVAALTENMVATLNGPSRGGRVYLIAGAGPYFIYQHPEVSSAVAIQKACRAVRTPDGSGRFLVLAIRASRSRSWNWFRADEPHASRATAAAVANAPAAPG